MKKKNKKKRIRNGDWKIGRIKKTEILKKKKKRIKEGDVK